MHGIGTGPSAWRPQVEALEGEVLAPDLVPLYARGWAATVEGVTRIVEEHAPVDLCGLSLGALAALHVAAALPGAVRRLVVCAGFAQLPPSLRRRVRLLALVAGVVPSGLLHRGLVAELPAAHREAALAEIGPLGRRAIARLMREAAGVRVDPAGVNAHAPALVLWGERDRVNAKLGRALADALPDATGRELPGAGHVANLDQPSAFTAALLDFLTRADPT